jgi:hypothetical protein
MKIPVDDFPVTLDLEVDATWHKFRPGFHERGGLKLEPDEPAHWEVNSVTCNGKPVLYLFSDDDLERLAEQLGNEEDYRE